MRPDNDMMKALDMAERVIQEHRDNARRFALWRIQWHDKFGHWPQRKNRTVHTNGNVYKFPHRHGQYGVKLPGPGDAA